MAAVTGSFTATGNGTAATPNKHGRNPEKVNVSVSGTFVGTAVLERSFDAGTTYIPVLRPGGNTAVSYTAPSSEVLEEPEKGVLWRLRCSAYTSGTIDYRISNS